MPFFVSAKEGILHKDIYKIIEEKKLFDDKGWLNLLHYEGNKSVVDEKSTFFLSPSGGKNPKLEMYATIEAFYSENEKGDRHAICAFPARFQYIIKNTGFNKAQFPQVDCAGYREFSEKAPLDSVSIVFAAENNMVPSSIMGHIFVKIAGFSKEKLREHAFSYFATDFDETSPKAYLNVVFSSVDGIYALTPYSSKITDYLMYDQRVIWEIDLKLSAEQKQYFHKHMWELKEKNVKYSFIFHNCGTASVNLFKIVYDDFHMYKIFETPIDYVKKLEEDGNIEDIRFIASPEHKLKMIRDNYTLLEIYKVRAKKSDFSDKQKYLANQLHNFHESMGIIKNDIYKDIDESKLGLTEETKNILDAKPSSRIYVGYRHFNKDALAIEFMPLYQNFFDTSNAYFDDFETKIANFNIIYDDKLYINKLDIYTARSLIDSSMSWGMYSKHIGFSFENALEKDGFNLKPVFETGLGYSFAFYKGKIKPYILPKAGYRYDSYNNFYLVPEAGIILKPADDIKVVFIYEKYFDSKGNNRGFNERYTANAFYQLSEKMFLNFKYNKYSGTKTKYDEEFNAGIGFNF